MAVADAYSVNEDGTLTVPTPGVLTNDTDADGDALTAILVANVSHGTLGLNANGGFTYSPAANYNGADSFTYKANDGALDSNTVTVTLTVNSVNDAPTCSAGSGSTAEGTALNGSLAASCADVDSGSLTYAKVADPAHGSVTVNADGTFTYSPAANYNGSDSFTFRANDGSLDSNTATFTITVTAVNDAPVAVADAYSVNEDGTLFVPLAGVLTNDTDADGDALTAILVSNVSHGTLSLAADGGFTYSPAANYNGADSFTYKANDGALDSNTVTVTLTVNPVNDAPVAVAGSLYSKNTTHGPPGPGPARRATPVPTAAP